MKILVGLGNPGEKYEQNRHNAGFMAVDAIARRFNAAPWRKRFQGFAAEVEIGGEKCLLLKPSTYMNESGRAASEALRFYKVAVGDVIVFHDEIDLEPGKVRVKAGGGNAGNNGLRSLTAHIGNDYRRVRIGVGHPGSREAVAYYVLHDFSREERDWLEVLLPAMADAAPHLVAGEDARFMNEIARHTRPAVEKQAKATVKDGDAKPQPETVQTASKAEKTGEAKETSLGAKLRGWLNRR